MWRAFFPYPAPRPHQAPTIEALLDALSHQAHVLLHAPTGSGKTPMVLAAVLPYALEHQKTILYLTRTHSQANRVESEVRKIMQKCKHHAPFRAINLSAKTALCEFQHDPAGQWCQKCPKKLDTITPGGFDAALYNEDNLTQYAERTGTCSYGLMKAIIPACTLVLGTYPHLVTPIRSLFFTRDWSEYLIIIDECHNLQFQLEDYFSLHVPAADWQWLHTIPLPPTNPWKKILADPSKLFPLVMDPTTQPGFLEFKTALLKHHPPPAVSSWIFGINHLLPFAPTLNLTDLFFFERDDHGIHHHCLDGLPFCRQIFTAAYALISMSGTLHTKSYRRRFELTEGPRPIILITMPYTFPLENMVLFYTPDTPFQYAARTPELYARVVRRLQEIVPLFPNKIGIFCGSYEILTALTAAGLPEICTRTQRELYAESPHQPAHAMKDLITTFKSTPKPAVLLGVCGGRFAEGEDFDQNCLPVVLLIGLPFTPPSPAQAAKERYFALKWGDSAAEYWRFSPALNKVNQTLGRGIRSATDRCEMIVWDSRIATFRDELMPWLGRLLSPLPSLPQLREQVRMFFRVHPAGDSPHEWIEYVARKHGLSPDATKQLRTRVTRYLMRHPHINVLEYCEAICGSGLDFLP
jgi:DNA excision repair protein ERCC-2